MPRKKKTIEPAPKSLSQLIDEHCVLVKDHCKVIDEYMKSKDGKVLNKLNYISHAIQGNKDEVNKVTNFTTGFTPKDNNKCASNQKGKKQKNTPEYILKEFSDPQYGALFGKGYWKRKIEIFLEYRTNCDSRLDTDSVIRDYKHEKDGFDIFSGYSDFHYLIEENKEN